MNPLRHLPSAFAALVLTALPAAADSDPAVDWRVDNTSLIGGNPVVVHGSPAVTGTPEGPVVCFDGVDDGLVVQANPIAGAAAFTVELVFRPDPSTHETSREPRMLHIQSEAPLDNRLTIEARMDGDSWYLDTFLRSGGGSPNRLTLTDPAKRHPAGRWYHVALVYDGAVLRHYVNGVPELSGEIAVPPLTPGVTSLGMRGNLVNFLQGAIRSVRFTPCALEPSEFMAVPGVEMQPSPVP